jgi:hypothetical protein
MFDIVYQSRIDILRHEVGESLQQGILGMRASGGQWSSLRMA